MKKHLALLSVFIVLATSCVQDDIEPTNFDYVYHAHIIKPLIGVKTHGQALDIDVLFESHVDEYIHNINIRVFSKTDSVELYNKPLVSRVDSPMAFNFIDTLHLSQANGFISGQEYVVESKIWATEDGESEESESITFQVQ